MKKVLILTTSYGQGHMAAAEAISEGIDMFAKQKVEVEIVDFTEIISSLLNKATKRMYMDTAKYLPHLYKLFFDLTDTEAATKAINELNYVFSREKILRFFIDKSPNLIICNSPHWQYIASLARQEELKNIPMVSVVTDIVTIHASWVVGNPDYFLAANQETALALQGMDVPKKKIKTLGYPVKQEFYENHNKKEILRQLSIGANQKVILFLASGLKPSFVQDTLEELANINIKTKTIVVTGRDDKLFGKLKSQHNHDMMLINWTSNLSDFVAISDIVITKAGGSSVMECIVAKKPVIISKIIPGQESGNAEYISDNRLGIIALDPLSIADATIKILGEYQDFMKSLKKYTKGGSIKDISKFLIGLMAKYNYR